MTPAGWIHSSIVTWSCMHTHVCIHVNIYVCVYDSSSVYACMCIHVYIVVLLHNYTKYPFVYLKILSAPPTSPIFFPSHFLSLAQHITFRDLQLPPWFAPNLASPPPGLHVHMPVCCLKRYGTKTFFSHWYCRYPPPPLCSLFSDLPPR